MRVGNRDRTRGVTRAGTRARTRARTRAGRGGRGGGMLGLAVATVRARRTAFAGSFTALLLGVAVLTMSALILLSGDGGVPGRYAGAPVLVRSAQGGTGPDGVFLERAPWPAQQTKELTRALTAVPGVRRAVPDRSFYAQAVADGGPARDAVRDAGQ
ncbi:hypothetical protein AB4212_55450, partial [Streptomyces sp. 2MCAF27]